jgi:hypothetical protein
MGKRNIAFYYEKLSPEDQHTFNRWLKANAIGGRYSRSHLSQWHWRDRGLWGHVMRRSRAARKLRVLPCRNSAGGTPA